MLDSFPSDDFDSAPLLQQIQIENQPEFDVENEEETDDPHFAQSYIPQDVNLRTEDVVRSRVQQVNYSRMDNEPVNEFRTEGFLSMAFP